LRFSVGRGPCAIAHSWPVGRPYPSVMKKSGMSNWAPLAPSKPGGPSKSPAARFTSVLKPTKPSALGSTSSGPLIGRWPESILLRIVESLPVPDLPNVARSSRALSRIVRDERGWEARCRILGIKSEDGERSRPWDFIVRSYYLRPEYSAQTDADEEVHRSSTEILVR